MGISFKGTPETIDIRNSVVKPWINCKNINFITLVFWMLWKKLKIDLN